MGVGSYSVYHSKKEMFLSQINVGGQGQNGGCMVRKGSGSLSLLFHP